MLILYAGSPTSTESQPGKSAGQAGSLEPGLFTSNSLVEF